MIKKKAQAFVEFVLISIPFLILLMGVFQFGHIAVAKIVVNHAVFVTTRVASVHTQYDMLFQVASEVIPFKDKENIKIEVSSMYGDQDIKIKLTYNMPLIFPFANKIIKEAKNLPDYKFPVVAEYILPKEKYVS